MNYKYQRVTYLHSSIINTLEQWNLIGFVKINSMAIKNNNYPKQIIPRVG